MAHSVHCHNHHGFHDVLLCCRHSNSPLGGPHQRGRCFLGVPLCDDSDSKTITYRAILSVGLDYKIFNKPVSPSVTLKAGVDRWGYHPEVVTPSHAGSPAVHIDGDAITNGFVRLELNVPFA